VRAAEEALEHGRMEAGRRLALAASRVAPDNESAWLILGHTAPSSDAADCCFERALELMASDRKMGAVVGLGLPLPGHREAPELTERAARRMSRRAVEARGGAGRRARGAPSGSLPRCKLQPSLAAHGAIRARAWLFALDYLLALAAAEVTTLFVDAGVGLALHGFILLILLLHGSLAADPRSRRLFLTLSLLPLVRLLSLSLPMTGRPDLEWYLVLGVLLSLATVAAMRVTGLGVKQIGITFRAWPIQVCVGSTGLGLGLLGYLVYEPQPLSSELSFHAIVVPALILLLVTGFIEEIVCRGLILQAAVERLGWFGIVYAAAISAILQLAIGPGLHVALVFLLGVAFGLFVLRSRSLLGVSLAHGLMNASMYLVLPFLLPGR
jgi:membrane protease YdiL (CAAX protease family)